MTTLIECSPIFTMAKVPGGEVGGKGRGAICCTAAGFAVSRDGLRRDFRWASPYFAMSSAYFAMSLAESVAEPR